MIVVGAIWEDGWFDNKNELDLWYYPLKDFGVNELAMTPMRGMNTNKVREFSSVRDMIRHYGLPVIVCTEDGESELNDFTHPEDALYLFNRTSGGNLPIIPDHTLKIETKLNKGMLWGHQAASIILYDRFKKWQYQ